MKLVAASGTYQTIFSPSFVRSLIRSFVRSLHGILSSSSLQTFFLSMSLASRSPLGVSVAQTEKQCVKSTSFARECAISVKLKWKLLCIVLKCLDGVCVCVCVCVFEWANEWGEKRMAKPTRHKIRHWNARGQIILVEIKVVQLFLRDNVWLGRSPGLPSNTEEKFFLIIELKWHCLNK